MYAYTVFKNPFLHLDVVPGTAISRPEASWRRMIISQPLVHLNEDRDIPGRIGGFFGSFYFRENQIQAVLMDGKWAGGMHAWKTVEYANEMGLVRRPKAWWV